MADLVRDATAICGTALAPTTVPTEWSGLEALQAAVAALRDRFDGILSAPPSDSDVERAVRRLIANAQLTARQLELCCAGIRQRVSVDGHDGDEITIADSSILTERLLEGLSLLDGEAAATRPAIALVRSLLTGERDPRSARVRNIERLAEGLYALIARTPGLINQAVRAMLERIQPIVVDHDVSGLVPAVLNKRLELLGDLQRLGVPSTSWVWAELTDRAADAAEMRDAVEYRRLVPTLLEWLNDQRREHLLEDGLGRIVRHLAGLAERDELPQVRDLAIEHWGNPHLESNHRLWRDRASEPGRRLVASWVVRQVIDLFFNTLTGYGDPQGRSSYWSKHAEEIDELWVYASRALTSDMSTDARALRELLGRRLCRLTAEAETSVFVMRIGEHLFAEFSTSGNALYVYQRGECPHPLGVDGVKAANFKDEAMGLRVRHDGRWQVGVDRWVKQGITTKR